MARYVEVVNERRTIALEIKLDGRQAISETTCVCAGPYVLVIATALPEAGLAIEIHSTFVGHAGVPTHATHLALGPVGYSPLAITAEHEHADLDPQTSPRQCAYEHAEIVLEILNGLGHQAAIDLPDVAFTELERIDG